MKRVKIEVWDQVDGRVWNQAWYKALGQVGNQVGIQVWNQVWVQFHEDANSRASENTNSA